MTFRLKNEDGVAMPVMTWMLVVVSLLLAWRTRRVLWHRPLPARA